MVFTTIDQSLVPSALTAIQNLPNILYNGGLEVHQNTNSNANNNYVNGDYFVDGWKFNKNSNRQMNGGYETTASNVYEGTASLKADSLSGNTTADYIFQSVENFARYANKTLTFSVAVKTNTASAVRAFISFSGPGASTLTGSFHTGGNTFEILTVSGTMGSAPGSISIGIQVNGQCTTYMDAAICVVGSSVPTFLPEDPEVELARCQRYYEKTYVQGTVPGTVTATNNEWFYGSAFGATSTRFTGHFKVEKRIAPTMSFFGTNGTSNQYSFRSSTDVNTNRTIALNDNNTRDFQFIQTTGTEITCFGHWVADARI